MVIQFSYTQFIRSFVYLRITTIRRFENWINLLYQVINLQHQKCEKFYITQKPRAILEPTNSKLRKRIRDKRQAWTIEITNTTRKRDLEKLQNYTTQGIVNTKLSPEYEIKFSSFQFTGLLYTFFKFFNLFIFLFLFIALCYVQRSGSFISRLCYQFHFLIWPQAKRLG